MDFLCGINQATLPAVVLDYSPKIWRLWTGNESYRGHKILWLYGDDGWIDIANSRLHVLLDLRIPSKK